MLVVMMASVFVLLSASVSAEGTKNGWETVGTKKYYYKNGAAQKGRVKIGKKWYFFKSSGVMATKDTKEKKVTYFINKNNNLEAFKKGKNYYKPGGKKMNKEKREDYKTLQRARKIVKKITKSSMTKQQKLKVCFDYVIKFPYKRCRIPFPANDKSWVSLYANDHFVRKGGDCHADAAAFAYLAKACGYKDVYVCIDAKLSNPNHHAWTYVDGLYYDPLFAEAKSYSAYWAAKKVKLIPIVKKRVAVGYVGDK